MNSISESFHGVPGRRGFTVMERYSSWFLCFNLFDSLLHTSDLSVGMRTRKFQAHF